MKGRIREDILDYLKSQQYVSSNDALEEIHFGDPVDGPQFEADFDATLIYFLEHVEAIEVPLQ